ncbi:MAG: peptidylprolyl isomerase [Prevotellaceae bacterium]|jgi:peptidyl-prolyl cis-trans isomerase SurA|nr:peptidylprolyl isomerase [Prevotellaceae bacterium]
MIKKLTAIAIFTFTLISLNAQISLDKVVAIVGNEAILESDVDILYKEMQIQGELPEDNPRCRILKMLIDQKLLVAQAKADSLTSPENIQHGVDRTLAEYIAQLGNKEMLEVYFSKSFDLLREEMIESRTEQSYAQAMQMEIARKVKVTPNEVNRFFKSIAKDSLPVIPDQYMIYELVKKPNSNQAMIDVKEKLLDLRRRIIKGEKFQTLATLYSEDPMSARRGGEIGLSPLEGNVLSVRLALMNMRIGQVSKIIESEYGFHILQLLEKQEETGFFNYRHILLKPKYTQEDQTVGFSRLDSIVKKIEADSISFENAALYYSDNEKSSLGNGLLVNANYQTGEIRTRFYKDELNPEDFKAIEHLGVGEISEPFVSRDISGNEVYKVVLLKEFIPSHAVNIKDDFSYISKIYENRKQNEAIQDWLKKKVKTEYVRINSKYEGCPDIDASWVF